MPVTKLSLMPHAHTFLAAAPPSQTYPVPPIPQPSQSYLIGFTITDISCPSSGQRHVDSGLCPEIKQYVVTGKKPKTHTHNSMRISHTHTFTHGRPVVTPRQKRQIIATESLHFHVASQFTEPWNHMDSSLLTK